MHTAQLRSIVVMAVAVLLAGCDGTAGTSTGAASQASPPAPSPSLHPSPSATPSVTSSAPAPAGFTCADSMAHVDGPGPVQARIVSIDAAGHQDMGFDRFVIRFDSSPSAVSVRLQETATFTAAAKGGPIALEGSAGALVVVDGVDVASYTGPTDLKPEGTILREARQTGAFEGQVQWALGLARPACIRVVEPFIGHLLVVDVTVR